MSILTSAGSLLLNLPCFLRGSDYPKFHWKHCFTEAFSLESLDLQKKMRLRLSGLLVESLK